MIILGGSACGEIGPNLARLLKARYFSIERRDFPDGEFVVKVPFDAKGKDIAIVQSTYAPHDRHLMELLFIADALSSMGAKSISAVVPYLAYMRQDRRFLDGQVVSSHVIMKLLNAAGISRLVTVQPHKEEPFRMFRGKVIPVYPVDTLIDAIAKGLREPYVLAPDKGGLGLATRAAELLGCGYAHIEKERDPVTGAVSIRNAPEQRFDGKQVLVVDDMISTGGTIALAAEFAYSRGAAEVDVAAVHLVMAGDAYDRLRKARITRIYGTNTIPFGNASVVDVSGPIADALR